MIPARDKETIFSYCENLFRSGIMEECLIACLWSDKVSKHYEITDFLIFETWVSKYVSNWAVCDTLCNHPVGNLMMKFPGLAVKLTGWAHSEQRWVKRASAVSLIIPARKGLFLDIIFEIADILLLDKDDMVQKGYGWMLKSAADANLAGVYDYIMKRKHTMPRTSLRYAIEKMPPDMRAEAMGRRGALR
jgi:3-methyladenine DNA glycosylase AlkD